MSAITNKAALDSFRQLQFADENTIVQQTKTGDFKSGGVWSESNKLRWIRLPGTKSANNEIRSQLLSSLGTAFNIQGQGTDAKGHLTFTPEFMAALREKLGADVFKEDDFGMSKNGLVSSGCPLTQRRITAIVNKADETMKAMKLAEEKRVSDILGTKVTIDETGVMRGEDGYTEVDRFGLLNQGSKLESHEDEELSPEQIVQQFEQKEDEEVVDSQSQAVKENVAEEIPQPSAEDLKAARAKAVKDAHDKLLADLQQQVRSARTEAKGKCMKICEDLIKGLSEEYLGGKDGVQGLLKDILLKTLANHGAGLYESVVDENLAYGQYDDVEDVMDLLQANEPKVEVDPDDPQAQAEQSSDIKALRKELEFLQAERESEDFAHDVGVKVDNFVSALNNALAMREKGEVDERQFGKCLDDKNIGYGHDLRVTPSRMFANAQTRDLVNAKCEALASSAAKFIADHAIIGAELPSSAAEMRQLLDAELAKYRDAVKGELDGKRFDYQEIMRGFEGTEHTVNAKLDELLRTASDLNKSRIEFLDRTKVLEYANQNIAKLSSRLESEDLAALNQLVKFPEGELKEKFDRALADFKQQKYGSSDTYGRDFRAAFDALAKQLVEKREAEGAKLIEDNVKNLIAMSGNFFNPESPDKFSSLEKMSLYNDGLKDHDAASLFIDLRKAALNQALEKIRNTPVTPREVNLDNLKQYFRVQVRDAIFRAEHTRLAVDELLASKDFRAKVHDFGMKHFNAKLFLNDKEEKSLYSAIDALRRDLYVEAMGDESVNVQTGYDNLAGLETKVLNWLAQRMPTHT